MSSPESTHNEHGSNLKYPFRDAQRSDNHSNENDSLEAHLVVSNPQSHHKHFNDSTSNISTHESAIIQPATSIISHNDNVSIMPSQDTTPLVSPSQTSIHNTSRPCDIITRSSIRSRDDSRSRLSRPRGDNISIAASRSISSSLPTTPSSSSTTTPSINKDTTPGVIQSGNTIIVPNTPGTPSQRSGLLTRSESGGGGTTRTRSNSRSRGLSLIMAAPSLQVSALFVNTSVNTSSNDNNTAPTILSPAPATPVAPPTPRRNRGDLLLAPTSSVSSSLAGQTAPLPQSTDISNSKSSRDIVSMPQISSSNALSSSDDSKYSKHQPIPLRLERSPSGLRSSQRQSQSILSLSTSYGAITSPSSSIPTESAPFASAVMGNSQTLTHGGGLHPSSSRKQVSSEDAPSQLSIDDVIPKPPMLTLPSVNDEISSLPVPPSQQPPLPGGSPATNPPPHRRQSSIELEKRSSLQLSQHRRVPSSLQAGTAQKPPLSHQGSTSRMQSYSNTPLQHHTSRSSIAHPSSSPTPYQRRGSLLIKTASPSMLDHTSPQDALLGPTPVVVQSSSTLHDTSLLNVVDTPVPPFSSFGDRLSHFVTLNWILFSSLFNFSKLWVIRESLALSEGLVYLLGQIKLLATLTWQLINALSHGFQWVIMLTRLVMMASSLLPLWLVMIYRYIFSGQVVKGVRYGPNARNFVDIYLPTDCAREFWIRSRATKKHEYHESITLRVPRQNTVSSLFPSQGQTPLHDDDDDNNDGNNNGQSSPLSPSYNGVGAGATPTPHDQQQQQYNQPNNRPTIAARGNSTNIPYNPSFTINPPQQSNPSELTDMSGGIIDITAGGVPYNQRHIPSLDDIDPNSLFQSSELLLATDNPIQSLIHSIDREQEGLQADVSVTAARLRQHFVWSPNNYHLLGLPPSMLFDRPPSEISIDDHMDGQMSPYEYDEDYDYDSPDMINTIPSEAVLQPHTPGPHHDDTILHDNNKNTTPSSSPHTGDHTSSAITSSSAAQRSDLASALDRYVLSGGTSSLGSIDLSYDNPLNHLHSLHDNTHHVHSYDYDASDSQSYANPSTSIPIGIGGIPIHDASSMQHGANTRPFFGGGRQQQHKPFYLGQEYDMASSQGSYPSVCDIEHREDNDHVDANDNITTPYPHSSIDHDTTKTVLRHNSTSSNTNKETISQPSSLSNHHRTHSLKQQSNHNDSHLSSLTITSSPSETPPLASHLNNTNNKTPATTVYDLQAIAMSPHTPNADTPTHSSSAASLRTAPSCNMLTAPSLTPVTTEDHTPSSTSPAESSINELQALPPSSSDNNKIFPSPQRHRRSPSHLPSSVHRTVESSSSSSSMSPGYETTLMTNSTSESRPTPPIHHYHSPATAGSYLSPQRASSAQQSTAIYIHPPLGMKSVKGNGAPIPHPAAFLPPSQLVGNRHEVPPPFYPGETISSGISAITGITGSNMTGSRFGGYSSMQDSSHDSSSFDDHKTHLHIDGFHDDTMSGMDIYRDNSDGHSDIQRVDSMSLTISATHDDNDHNNTNTNIDDTTSTTPTTSKMAGSNTLDSPRHRSHTTTRPSHTPNMAPRTYKMNDVSPLNMTFSNEDRSISDSQKPQRDTGHHAWDTSAIQLSSSGLRSWNKQPEQQQKHQTPLQRKSSLRQPYSPLLSQRTQTLNLYRTSSVTGQYDEFILLEQYVFNCLQSHQDALRLTATLPSRILDRYRRPLQDRTKNEQSAQITYVPTLPSLPHVRPRPVLVFIAGGAWIISHRLWAAWLLSTMMNHTKRYGLYTQNKQNPLPFWIYWWYSIIYYIFYILISCISCIYKSDEFASLLQGMADAQAKSSVAGTPSSSSASSFQKPIKISDNDNDDNNTNQQQTTTTSSSDAVMDEIETSCTDGFVCFALDYRNFPQGDIFDMITDCTTGVDWVIKNAHLYGGDPSQIFVMGQSAGAHILLLSALVAYRNTRRTNLEKRQCLSPDFDLDDTAPTTAVEQRPPRTTTATPAHNIQTNSSLPQRTTPTTNSSGPSAIPSLDSLPSTIVDQAHEAVTPTPISPTISLHVKDSDDTTSSIIKNEPDTPPPTTTVNVPEQKKTKVILDPATFAARKALRTTKLKELESLPPSWILKTAGLILLSGPYNLIHAQDTFYKNGLDSHILYAIMLSTDDQDLFDASPVHIAAREFGLEHLLGAGGEIDITNAGLPQSTSATTLSAPSTVPTTTPSLNNPPSLSSNTSLTPPHRIPPALSSQLSGTVPSTSSSTPMAEADVQLFRKRAFLDPELLSSVDTVLPHLVLPPTFIIHGTSDKTVDCLGAFQLFHLLRNCGGVMAYLDIFLGLSHTDLIIELPATGSDPLSAHIQRIMAYTLSKQRQLTQPPPPLSLGVGDMLSLSSSSTLPAINSTVSLTTPLNLPSPLSNTPSSPVQLSSFISPPSVDSQQHHQLSPPVSPLLDRRSSLPRDSSTIGENTMSPASKLRHVSSYKAYIYDQMSPAGSPPGSPRTSDGSDDQFGIMLSSSYDNDNQDDDPCSICDDDNDNDNNLESRTSMITGQPTLKQRRHTGTNNNNTTTAPHDDDHHDRLVLPCNDNHVDFSKQLLHRKKPLSDTLLSHHHDTPLTTTLALPQSIVDDDSSTMGHDSKSPLSLPYHHSNHRNTSHDINLITSTSSLSPLHSTFSPSRPRISSPSHNNLTESVSITSPEGNNTSRHTLLSASPSEIPTSYAHRSSYGLTEYLGFDQLHELYTTNHDRIPLLSISSAAPSVATSTNDDPITSPHTHQILPIEQHHHHKSPQSTLSLQSLSPIYSARGLPSQHHHSMTQGGSVPAGSFSPLYDHQLQSPSIHILPTSNSLMHFPSSSSSSSSLTSQQPHLQSILTHTLSHQPSHHRHHHDIHGNPLYDHHGRICPYVITPLDQEFDSSAVLAHQPRDIQHLSQPTGNFLSQYLFPSSLKAKLMRSLRSITPGTKSHDIQKCSGHHHNHHHSSLNDDLPTTAHSSDTTTQHRTDQSKSSSYSSKNKYILLCDCPYIQYVDGNKILLHSTLFYRLTPQPIVDFARWINPF